MEQALLPRVKTRLIIEMLGSPKEHVTQTLKDYMATLKKDKTVQVLAEDYAVPQDRGDGLFAVFVEVEMWFKDPNHLLAFCFDAMPSSIEIMEPLQFTLHAKDFEGLLNDLQARLHTVDLALKSLKATAKVIDSNAVNIFRNFIIHALKHGAKTQDDLAKIIGVTPAQLQAFLDTLVAEHKIKKEGNNYVA